MLPGRELCTFVREMNYEALPPKVKKYARFCLLDTIGCTIAGVHDAPVKLADFIPMNRMREATLIGKKRKASELDALYLNAYACSKYDLNRGLSLQFIHPGRLLTLAALVAGETLDASCKDALTAIILGYEMITRIGHAVKPIGWPPDDTRPDLATSLACFTLPGICDIAMNLLRTEVVGGDGIQANVTDSVDFNHQEYVASSSIKKTTPDNSIESLLMKMLSLLSASGEKQNPAKRSWDGVLINKIADEVKHSKELTARLGQKYLTTHIGLVPTISCDYVQSLIRALRASISGERIKINEISRLDFVGIIQYSVVNNKRFSDISDRMANATALLANQINPEAAWYLNGKLENKYIRELAGKIKFYVVEDDLVDWVLKENYTGKLIINTTRGLRKKTSIKHTFSGAEDVKTEHKSKVRFDDFVCDILGEKKTREIAEGVLTNDDLTVRKLLKLLEPSSTTLFKRLFSVD